MLSSSRKSSLLVIFRITLHFRYVLKALTHTLRYICRNTKLVSSVSIRLKLGFHVLDQSSYQRCQCRFITFLIKTNLFQFIPAIRILNELLLQVSCGAIHCQETAKLSILLVHKEAAKWVCYQILFFIQQKFASAK